MLRVCFNSNADMPLCPLQAAIYHSQASACSTEILLCLQVRFPLRKALHEHCEARPKKCLHYSPRGTIGRMNQTKIYEVRTQLDLAAPLPQA